MAPNGHLRLLGCRTEYIPYYIPHIANYSFVVLRDSTTTDLIRINTAFVVLRTVLLRNVLLTSAVAKYSICSATVCTTTECTTTDLTRC